MSDNKLWTTQEIRLLKQLVEVERMTWKEIALELDRSYHGVYHKYHKVKKRDKARHIPGLDWLR